jgi:hypothetical protein
MDIIIYFNGYINIGKYEDLFGYSSWKIKPTEREILRKDEKARIQKKISKKEEILKEEREKKLQIEEEEKEEQRQV